MQYMMIILLGILALGILGGLAAVAVNFIVSLGWDPSARPEQLGCEAGSQDIAAGMYL